MGPRMHEARECTVNIVTLDHKVSIQVQERSAPPSQLTHIHTHAPGRHTHLVHTDGTDHLREWGVCDKHRSFVHASCMQA
jgi:hypothetical protein